MSKKTLIPFTHKLPDGFNFWSHQLQAISRISFNKIRSGFSYFALFFEVGTGKTATLIHILNKLNTPFTNHSSGVKATKGISFIFSPLITLENWKRELETHLVRVDGPVKIIILRGSDPKRALEVLNNYNLYARGMLSHVIFITNYESLIMPQFYSAMVNIPEAHLRSIIFDESHKIKDIKAGRTKKAMSISKKFSFKFILTGTPFLNSIEDIFTQWNVLDGGAAFGNNFYAFRAKFFKDKNAGMPKERYFPDWVPKDGAEEEIKKIIAPHSATAKKSECLDLPPYVRVTIPVELGKEQLKHYNDLKVDFITYMGRGVCAASLAITKALRLQQVISGHLPLELEGGEKKIVHFEKNPRIEALGALLTMLVIEGKQKVIVWAVFKEDYAQIRKVFESLKLNHVEVHGEIKAEDKFKAVDAFNTDPNVQVFLGHPGSGGIGINLIAASSSIFYSRTFSLEYDLQAEARNYRGGSEIHEKITRYDIVASGTIDELINKALAEKKEIGETVLRDIASVL